MQKDYLFKRISLLLTGVFLLCLNAQAQGPFHYWPSYNQTPIEDINRVPWVVSGGIVDGWDWSLPPGTAPAPASKLITARNIYLTDQRIKDFPTVNFPCNPVVTHWLNWKDIEPTEDNYDWDGVRYAIDLCSAKGYKSVIRLMTCRAERSAPTWLADLGINTIVHPEGDIDYDPADSIFHQHYLNLIADFGATGIQNRDDVVGLYVGYSSKSWGDEGIGPVIGESDPSSNDTVQHVIERLDAWAAITDGIRHKMVMGGYSNHGLSLGFGIRRGFVEHYMYHTPDAVMGQLLDANNYMYVDESNSIIANNTYHGEENEEYQESWVDRFGPIDGYPYRYFSSNIRLLQMRTNAVLFNGFSLMPEMLAWVGQELGRTREDTPDAWCFLRETYVRTDVNANVKNFERWIYQRDTPGYETQAVIQIDKNYHSWIYDPSKPYDYIARKGQKIGFAADDVVFPTDVEQSVAIKVSYIDNVVGTLKLVYYNNSGPQEKTINTTGGDLVRTATFFVDTKFDASGFDYDFELHSEAGKEVPVSFVRVIKLPPVVDATGVTVTPETLTLGVGQTGELTATVSPYNATDQSVQWSSSSSSVATVASNGQISPLLVGTTTITATTNDGMYTDSCELKVVEVKVDELDNVTAPSQVSPGDTVSVSVEYEASETRDIRVFIQKNSTPWDSYGSNTITVAAGIGSITIDLIISSSIPLAANAYKIVVNLLPVGGAWPDRLHEIKIVDVSAVSKPIPVDGVGIDNCPSRDLTEGDIHQLVATVLPADASNQSVSWSSSDASVLIVDANGLLTAVNDGNATITVTTNDGGFTSSCELTVVAPIDRLTDAVIPDQVFPGDTIAVHAQYETSQSRDIGASIQLNSDPWTNYGSNTRTVPAGTGTDSLELIVSPDIPIADNAYKIVLGLLPVGGAWPERLDEVEIINVSVVKDSITSTIEKYIRSHFTGQDNDTFKVYPNPVSDILYLELMENCSVQITTIGGQAIYQGKAGSSIVALDVSSLNYKGIVFVQIISEDQVSTFRVIIE